MEEENQDIKDEKVIAKMIERYYFWYYCKTYGWRQIGKIDGYFSLKQLKTDCKYHFINGDEYRITKSRIINI